MNERIGKAPNPPHKILIIAIVIIFGIIALVFLALKRDIDFSLTAKPKDGEITVELKTEQEAAPGEASKKERGVEIHQESELVKGDLSGVKATNRSAEDLPVSIEVEQNVVTVEEGGSVTGLDLSQEIVKE